MVRSAKRYEIIEIVHFTSTWTPYMLCFAVFLFFVSTIKWQPCTTFWLFALKQQQQTNKRKSLFHCFAQFCHTFTVVWYCHIVFFLCRSFTSPLLLLSFSLFFLLLLLLLLLQFRLLSAHRNLYFTMHMNLYIVYSTCHLFYFHLLVNNTYLLHFERQDKENAKHCPNQLHNQYKLM